MEPPLNEERISSPNAFMKGGSQGTPGVKHKDRCGGFSSTVFTILV
jgi:hypothetical protein